MKKVIIDTDIGTDVDDSVALTLCLKSKKLDLKAVTTSVYNSKVRATIAKKLTKMLNHEVPVAYGPDYDKKWFIGFEGNGLLDGSENFEFEKDPVSLLSSMIKKHKSLELICIGPLGNTAELINSGIKPKHIYFMGGATEYKGKFIPNPDSHNVEVDLKSANTVFDSGVPITIVTKEVSKKAPLYRQDYEKIKKLNTPWTDYLYQNAIDWLNFKKQDFSYMYDPLTVALAEDKTMFKTKKRGNIKVVIDLDAKKFKKYLFNTLEGKK